MTSPSSWFSVFSNPFQSLVDEQKKIDEEKRQKDLEEIPSVSPSSSPLEIVELEEPNEKGKEEEEKIPLSPIRAAPESLDEIIIVEQEESPSSWIQQIKEWTEPMMPLNGRDINPFSVPVTEEAKKTRQAVTKEIEETRKEKLPHDLVSRSAANPLILPDLSQETPSVDPSQDPLLAEKRRRTDEELEKFNAAIVAYSLFLFLHEYAAGEQLPNDEEGEGVTYQKMVRRALVPKDGEEKLSLWQVYKESLGKDLNLFSYLKAFLFYHVFFTITQFIPTLVDALTKSTLNYSRKSLIKSEMLAFLSSRILTHANTYLNIIDGARLKFEQEQHSEGSVEDYIKKALEKSYTRQFEDLVQEDSARAVEFFFPDSISFCSLGENSSFAPFRKLGGAISSLVNYFTNALVKIILRRSIIPSIFRSTITNAIDIAPAKSYIFTRGIYRVAAEKVRKIREDLDTPQRAKETSSVKLAGIENLPEVSSILVKVLDPTPNQTTDISKELEIGIAKGGKIALEMLHDKKVMEDLFTSLFSSLYESLISEETFQELKDDHEMWEEALNSESDELFVTLTAQAIQEKLSPPSDILEEQIKMALMHIKKKNKTIFLQLEQLMPIMEQIAVSINDPEKIIAISNELRKASQFAESIKASLSTLAASSVYDRERTQTLFGELQELLTMIESISSLIQPPEKIEQLSGELISLLDMIQQPSGNPEQTFPTHQEELSLVLQQILSLIQETEKKQLIPFEYGFTAIDNFCNLMQKINQHLDLKNIVIKYPEMTEALQTSFDRMLQPIRSDLLKLTGLLRQLNRDQNCHYLCSKADRSLSKLSIGWSRIKQQLDAQETDRLVETFSPTLQALQETIRLSQELQMAPIKKPEELEKAHQELTKLLETIQHETSIINQLRSLIENKDPLPLVAKLVHLRQYPDKPLDYFDARATKQKVLLILKQADLDCSPFTSMIDQMQTYLPPNLRKEWGPFQGFILRQIQDDQNGLKQLLEEAFNEWRDLPRGKGIFDLVSWGKDARKLLQKANPSDTKTLQALLNQTKHFLSNNSIIPVYWCQFYQQIQIQIDLRAQKRNEALRSYQESVFMQDFLEQEAEHLNRLQQTTYEGLQTNLQEIQRLLKELSQMTDQLELPKSYSPDQVITGLGLAAGLVIGGAAALLAPPALGAIALTTGGAVVSHFHDPKQPRLISAVKGAAMGTLFALTGPIAPIIAGSATGLYGGQRATQTATEYGKEIILPRIKTIRKNFFALAPILRKPAMYSGLVDFSGGTERVF